MTEDFDPNRSLVVEVVTCGTFATFAKPVRNLFPSELDKRVPKGDFAVDDESDRRVYLITTNDTFFEPGSDGHVGRLSTGSQGWGDSIFHVISVRWDEERGRIYHAGWFENLYFGKWKKGMKVAMRYYWHQNN